MEPSGSLRFDLQAGADSIAHFKLTNNSSSRAIAFKTQTTKPGVYQVRPSLGLLDAAGNPGSCAYVTVLLKGERVDQALQAGLDGEQKMDKFKLQFLSISLDECNSCRRGGAPDLDKLRPLLRANLVRSQSRTSVFALCLLTTPRVHRLPLPSYHDCVRPKHQICGGEVLRSGE